MKRAALLATAIVLVLGEWMVGAGPAEAASGITIRTIPAKTAPYGGTVTIKPLVSTRGKVRIKSKRLTVTRAGTTIRKSVTYANLHAGYYGVTTVVKYRVIRNGSWTRIRTMLKVQSLRVTQEAEAITEPAPDDKASTTPCGSQTYRKADGSACDDGDPCTTGETYLDCVCQGGVQTFLRRIRRARKVVVSGDVGDPGRLV